MYQNQPGSQVIAREVFQQRDGGSGDSRKINEAEVTEAFRSFVLPGDASN
jgi:hypothetical protein